MVAISRILDTCRMHFESSIINRLLFTVKAAGHARFFDKSSQRPYQSIEEALGLYDFDTGVIFLPEFFIQVRIVILGHAINVVIPHYNRMWTRKFNQTIFEGARP